MTNPNLDIVFEDDHIMVIDKPPNLVSSPAEGLAEQTLSDILKSNFNLDLERAGVAHRLDKDTSGLLIIAKTYPILLALQAQFKDRTIKKTYIALVHKFTEPNFSVDLSIKRNPSAHHKFIVHSEGRDARTDFKLLSHYRLNEANLTKLFPKFKKAEVQSLINNHYTEFSLLECSPFTGRTHQIRVHLKYANHPLVGDDKYTGRKTYRLDHVWCPRQFLHATSIEFTHPLTGERLNISRDLPKDLAEVLTNLDKVDS